LNILNRLYQKYIQSRMLDEYGRSVKRKNNLIIQSIEDAKQNMADLKRMRYKHNSIDTDELNSMYVNGELLRMRNMIQHDSISLKQFHDYFDEVMLVPDKEEKKIYQEIFDPTLSIPMDKAFALMEVFALYMTWKLTENP